MSYKRMILNIQILKKVKNGIIFLKSYLYKAITFFMKNSHFWAKTTFIFEKAKSCIANSYISQTQT